MRIEIVTDTYSADVNGVSMTLGRLVAGLRRRGHLVHVLHTGEEGEPGETVLPSVALPGYKEVRLGLPSGSKVLRRWRKKPPDVIYVATESPLGSSAIKVANTLGIPVAAGFHTNFDTYLERYHLGKLKGAAQQYLKKVHNRADCTLAPSPDVVQRLKEEGYDNVHLLGRGVDTDLFHPSRRSAELRTQWGARVGSKVAVMVGRLAPEKNLELGLEAFKRMRTAVPDMQCVVVGDGPSRAGLEKECAFAHFVGMQRGEDLATHYASADILLFPSETETFGNVLLEGMASGLITVSYDYAASAKVVEHGTNGLKASLGDEEGFLKQAVNALSLKNRDELQGKARASVEGQGWEAVITTFEDRLRQLSESAPVNWRTGRKKPRKQSFRTIIISDLHLGTKDAKVREVVDFLKNSYCERLILNGDIVDGWALKRGGKWQAIHTRFVRTVLGLIEKHGVEVVYLRGNHDEILDSFLPVEVGGLRMAKELIHESADGKRYLVVHGDGFDRVTSHYRWLARAGAVGYDLLLLVNRVYNRFRQWRGKGYFSMSKMIKAKVKAAVSWIDDYQRQLQEYARRRKCDGIICGHIHTPADEQENGVHYLNSGDWVETLSAVVEHHDGRFEVLTYKEFLRRAFETSEQEEFLDREADRFVQEGEEVAVPSASEALP